MAQHSSQLLIDLSLLQNFIAEMSILDLRRNCDSQLLFWMPPNYVTALGCLRTSQPFSRMNRLSFRS